MRATDVIHQVGESWIVARPEGNRYYARTDAATYAASGSHRVFGPSPAVIANATQHYETYAEALAAAELQCGPLTEEQ